MSIIDRVRSQPPSVRTAHRLEVITDPAEFAALRGDWLELQRRDRRCSVFQTHTWLTHIGLFEQGPNLRWQVALVYGPDGRLVAAMPMVIQKRLGPVGVRVMRLLGRGFTDYQDMLLADDCDHHTVLTLLSRWLRSATAGLDRIEILRIPEDSHLWEHRERLLPKGSPGWSLRTPAMDPTRHLPIEGDFGAYLMTLSKPTRKNYRRYWKTLNESHRVEFNTLTRSDGSDELLGDLVRLHQQRQNERGQRGLFRSPQRIEVFTRLFKAMLDEGTLRLHVLRIDGKTYNADLVFYHQGTATAYNGGMDNDPAIAGLSPGFLAMFRAIEHAHAKPGMTRFDLGQGDEPYKSRIAKHERNMYQLDYRLQNLRCRLDDLYNRVQAWSYASPWVKRLYFGVRR